MIGQGSSAFQTLNPFGGSFLVGEECELIEGMLKGKIVGYHQGAASQKDFHAYKVEWDNGNTGIVEDKDIVHTLEYFSK